MAIELFMPALSPTMKEGIIAKWHKKEGDMVEPGDVICDIMTDKSTVEYQALDGGILKKITTPEGKSVKVNERIGVLVKDMKEDISALFEKPEAKQTEETPVEEKREEALSVREMPVFAPFGPVTGYEFPSRDSQGIRASPLAKRLAHEQNLDLSKVKGTGPHGRIVEDDLKGAPKLSQGSIEPKEGPPVILPGTYHEIPLTPIRKAIGSRLQDAKASIPHFYVTMEVDASKLVSLRKEIAEVGHIYTYNDFILRAAALALEKHPTINRGYNSQNETLIQFETIDISLAVSIPDGLITPILFHANYKDLSMLSVEAKSLAKRAVQGTLQPFEYQGGSFTVSNLGMFGVASFDAVINPPQAAILAVGGILERPLVRAAGVVAGYVLMLTLSCDHRVIDGADGAKFLQTIKFYLEKPAALLL